MEVRFYIKLKRDDLVDGDIVTTYLTEMTIDLTAVNLSMPLEVSRVGDDYNDPNLALRERTFGRRWGYTLKWGALQGEELTKLRQLLSYANRGDQRSLLGEGLYVIIDIKPVIGGFPPTTWELRAQNTYQTYFPKLDDVQIMDSYKVQNLKNKYIEYFEDMEIVVTKRELKSLGSAGITPVTETGGII